MFDKGQIERAVELQAQCYDLLQWLASAVRRGFISFGAAHSYSSLPVAAEAWIAEHYLNLPKQTQPRLEDLKEFSAMFSTFLQNSFDLVRDPGKRLYSPHCHCYCPMCSWLVDAPNLKTKKPTTADRRRARKMMLTELTRIASEHGTSISDDAAAVIVDDPTLGEKTALCAYGSDLLRRTAGKAAGPASLVLWRRFAWLPKGSPRKNFKLTADTIIDAELELRDQILGCVASDNGIAPARQP